MRDIVIANLSVHMPPFLAIELVAAYEQLLAKQRMGDLQAALTEGGRFVEQVFRVIEFVRSGSAPTEIRSVSKAMRDIESDTSLPEPLRFLIPRAAYGMIYDLRSKRNAVHVKEIDPTSIDVGLTVAGASWIVAELLRMFHNDDESTIEQAMLALTRTSVPLIEAIDGEVFVSRPVPSKKELMLLLAHAQPAGLSRSELGKMAKCSQPAVTNGLKELISRRLVHLSAAKHYCLTSNGEQAIADWLLSTQ